MLYFKHLFSFCLLTVLLSACGQKGPLYLPETKQIPSTEEHK